MCRLTSTWSVENYSYTALILIVSVYSKFTCSYLFFFWSLWYLHKGRMLKYMFLVHVLLLGNMYFSIVFWWVLFRLWVVFLVAMMLFCCCTCWQKRWLCTQNIYMHFAPSWSQWIFLWWMCALFVLTTVVFKRYRFLLWVFTLSDRFKEGR